MYKKMIKSILKLGAFIVVAFLLNTELQAASWGYEPADIPPENWGTISGFETCGVVANNHL